METVSPFRELSDTNALSHLLWNHNCHVVPHLLAASAAIESLIWQVRDADALSVSGFFVCGWQQKAKKHRGVPEKGQQWSLFSFCLAFVMSVPGVCLLSCLRLMPCGCWSRWTFAEAPGACRQSVCHPAGSPCHLGSCHPGEGDTPWWSTRCQAGNT